MKRLLFSLSMMAVTTLLLTGCSKKTYYQVYQAKPVDDEACLVNVDFITHDAGDVVVKYNFFGENGNAGFFVTNNSNELVTIDLSESFFILNGMANAFYQGREWTETESHSTTMSFQTSASKKEQRRARRNATGTEATMYGSNASTAGSTTATTSALMRAESRFITVPPQGTRYVSEYNINSVMRSMCGVKESPSASKPAGMSFTVENSPLTFAIFVSYTMGNKAIKMHVNDQFYVSEIMNVNQKTMFKDVQPVDACGKSSGDKVKQIQFNTANRFYVKYKR